MKRLAYILAFLFSQNAFGCLISDSANDSIDIDSSLFEEILDDEEDIIFEEDSASLDPSFVMEQSFIEDFTRKAYLDPHRLSAEKDTSSVSDSRSLSYPGVINYHVPSVVDLDLTKQVGEIECLSDIALSGAKTYTIPIKIYPGMNDFQPNLSLSYNSQQGNGVVGVGWSLSGVSQIARVSKTTYYNGKTEGVCMDNTDGFILDGLRFNKRATLSNYIQYVSETGFIKAIGYISGNVLKYFKVLYPNGTRATFGYTTNTQNRLYYPLTSMTDLWGNTITYSYSFSDNHYTLNQISYNNSSVEFQYNSSRTDPIVSYCAGYTIQESKLLSSITCKYGNTEIGKYSLVYIVEHGKSLMAKVDYTADGDTYNPLRFYYGTGNTSSSYSQTQKNLYNYYNNSYPNQIRLVRGRYNYSCGRDGIVLLRNKQIYRKNGNVLENDYISSEKLFLYADVADDTNIPYQLPADTGFIDVLGADLDGSLEDCIVKVNNIVQNQSDHLTLNAYSLTPSCQLTSRYSLNYNFPTVCQGGGTSFVQPKFFYQGDFDGDGKMEILAVSAHQPLGNTNVTSKCYLFDLSEGTKSFDGYLFPYAKAFATSFSDEQNAENNSDKVLVADFDGDGKTDICHISSSGTTVYTFSQSDSILTAQTIGTFSTLTRSSLTNRTIFPCDFNGDGLADLLVSPSSDNNGTTWTIYNSKGNGQFVSSTFSGPAYSQNSTFLMQDVNGDGIADLLRMDAAGFDTYLTANNNLSSGSTRKDFPENYYNLIPADIKSRNHLSQLVGVKGSSAIVYTFSRNDRKEILATGKANSFGVVEKNEYRLLTEPAIPMQKRPLETAIPQFPYAFFNEPVPVLVASSTFMNGIQEDVNVFGYDNPMLHLQGRGFLGFEMLTQNNKRGHLFSKIFDPMNYSVLLEDYSPEAKKTYEYTITTGMYHSIVKKLDASIETDRLKNITATSTYQNNNFGYPTQKNTAFTGGIEVEEKYTYQTNETFSNGYYLCCPKSQITKTTRNSNIYREKTLVNSFQNCKPLEVIKYKDNRRIHKETYAYDAHGNILADSVWQYASSIPLVTSNSYDSYGRVSQQVNPKGLTETYVYDNLGRKDSKTDCHGTTSYTYNGLGQTITVVNPDNSGTTFLYDWSSNSEIGLIRIEKNEIGKPKVITYLDALKREVRKTDKRFDGRERCVDKRYDEYGNLWKVSMPYNSLSSPSLWTIHSYDEYHRITSSEEPSGRLTTTTYSGTSVTTTADGISTTKTYDVLGNLISVTDPTGTITYNLAADGQPTSIVAPGNITTTFGYDLLRRRTSITDPSAGTTSYQYDSSGNVSKETNANNQIITHTYDAFNRITGTVTPEMSTTYQYNNKDELTNVSSSNGTYTNYVYDSYGRLNTITEYVDSGAVWLRKEYEYTDGNVSAIDYTSHRGFIGTEERIYYNGHFITGKFNGSNLYTLMQENDLGQPTWINTGSMKREYTYDMYGLPTRRKASTTLNTFQNFSYTFDPLTHNLTSRTDSINSFTESFSYDSMKRLTTYGYKTAIYDTKGNIVYKSDVGTFTYDGYALTQANFGGSGATSYHYQSIDYTSFRRPAEIEDECAATFLYNANYDRVRMRLTPSLGTIKTTYYLGNCYELVTSGNNVTERLYLFGDYYNAPVVYVNDGNYYDDYIDILRDYLGSITHVVCYNTLIEENSYDAWGRLRNPGTGVAYSYNQQPTLFLGRGFTGHEHLPEFGLINMNARLYDPALGRFLSPDPYVQSPDFTQNFNRYSYVLNNPLTYVDENGELFIIDDFIWGIIKCIWTGENVWESAVKTVNNSLKIWKGLFTPDTNKGFWGGFGEILSRFTWQLPQTIIGFLFTSFTNDFWKVGNVTSLYGVSVLPRLNTSSSVTLGNFIVGSKDIEANPMNTIFQHEYGHYLQSQDWGLAYLLVVGIPSLFNTIGDPLLHNSKNYERDANYRAFQYFRTNVEGFKDENWNFVKNPLSKSFNERIHFEDKRQMDAIKNSLGFYKAFHFKY